MRQHHPVAPVPGGAGQSVPKQEIDYTPKDYTLGETLRYGWKYLAVAGVVLFLFWLIERYLY
jgi:hypothetical protein